MRQKNQDISCNIVPRMTLVRGSISRPSKFKIFLGGAVLKAHYFPAQESNRFGRKAKDLV